MDLWAFIPIPLVTNSVQEAPEGKEAQEPVKRTFSDILRGIVLLSGFLAISFLVYAFAVRLSLWLIHSIVGVDPLELAQTRPILSACLYFGGYGFCVLSSMADAGRSICERMRRDAHK